MVCTIFNIALFQWALCLHWRSSCAQKKFAVESWSEIEKFLSQDFLKFIQSTIKRGGLRKKEVYELPIFIGYHIPGGVFWQCALIDINNIPIYSEKNGTSYLGHFKQTAINWSQTKDCSYELFFGRGRFCPQITNKKILIIGIGAIGSMVAKTLTRGGAKYISLADYDIKEPENICRSEYNFISGVTSKVQELNNELFAISPFIDVKMFPEFTDIIKNFIFQPGAKDEIRKAVEKYELIFDCTADNDVAFILEDLSLTSDVINMSITNYAKELICVTQPNLYSKLLHISSLLDDDTKDNYNPTGCWNPTFKASYNDIASMVQVGLRNINKAAENSAYRSFYLKFDKQNIITSSF